MGLRKLIPFFLLVLVLLAACSPNQIVGKDPGVLRDQIFSREPRANGTISYWMVHDDTGTYCTDDVGIEKQMDAIFYSTDPTAFVSYRTLVVGDPQCGIEGTAANGFKTYMILSVKPLPQ